MPIKKCEVCGEDFRARLAAVRSCGTACRSKLIAAARIQGDTVEKACVVCHARFSVHGAAKKRQTCRPACAYILRTAHRRKQVERVCKTCGTTFPAVQNQVDAGAGLYCSKRCWYDRNKKSMTRPCVICGEPFSSPPSHVHVQTCSTECGYQLSAATMSRPKVALNCRQCGNQILEHGSKAYRRIYCSPECKFASGEYKAKKAAQVSGAGNPGWKGGICIQAVSASGRRYYRSSLEVELEKQARRKRIMAKATPRWADIDKMRAIYRTAQEMTALTGVPHHVDHIVPVNSKLVCGLHCESNLQVLIAVDNLSKSNRTWPDMP
jgi:hypothetical protein